MPEDHQSHLATGRRSQPAAWVSFWEHRNVYVPPVLLEHVHQVSTINQCDRFVFRELSAVSAEITCRHENSLRGTFRDHRTVKVADRRNRNDHVVSLGLDHEFAAPYWLRIKGNASAG